MQTTQERTTRRCGTGSSDSRPTNPSQTCSTSTPRGATSSLWSRRRCWTERWVGVPRHISQSGGKWRRGAKARWASLTRARQLDDCFSSGVTNARTSIGFTAGRGILAVVRHLVNSLIEVIHTHPSALVLSNKPAWKPAIRNCWNGGGRLSALMSQSGCYSNLFNRGVID